MDITPYPTLKRDMWISYNVEPSLPYASHLNRTWCFSSYMIRSCLSKFTPQPKIDGLFSTAILIALKHRVEKIHSYNGSLCYFDVLDELGVEENIIILGKKGKQRNNANIILSAFNSL